MEITQASYEAWKLSKSKWIPTAMMSVKDAIFSIHTLQPPISRFDFFQQPVLSSKSCLALGLMDVAVLVQQHMDAGHRLSSDRHGRAVYCIQHTIRQNKKWVKFGL
jgi:hypothetical protein